MVSSAVKEETVAWPRFLDPDILATHFHIEPGSTVVDFGAGLGTYTKKAAAKAGPHGKVVACEIQRALVDSLGKTAKAVLPLVIEPLWCDIEDVTLSRLDKEISDFGLLINTLSQLESHLDAILHIHQTLRAGGVLYVVDWQDSFLGIGPVETMVVSKQQAIDWFESNYFILEREYDAGDYHYGLAFRKIWTSAPLSLL